MELLSFNYEFEVEGENLYGINVLTKKKFRLCFRDDRSTKMLAIAGVKGFEILDKICLVYNQLKSQTDISQFFKQEISNVGRGNRYIYLK